MHIKQVGCYQNKQISQFIWVYYEGQTAENESQNKLITDVNL